MDFNFTNDSYGVFPVMDGASQSSGWAVSDIERSMFVRGAYGLIASVGIIGNALVVFVLIRIPSLRTRTSQFIIHLSVTDFLTCVWIIPFNLFPGSPALPGGLLGEISCRIFVSKFPLWATIFASVYSLVCVHLERFAAIVHPMRYKGLFTPAKSACLMAGSWAIGVISNAYFWLIFANEEGQCSIQPYAHRAIQIAVGVYTFSVVYIIPITFNFVVHKKMISALKEKAATLGSRKKTAANSKKVPGAKSARRKENWQLKTAHELSHTLLFVVITFAICWAPNQFFFFIYNMGADLPFDTPVYHATVIMAICNSCLNPFIYFFKNKHYRVGLKKALALICCCASVRTNWGSLTTGPPPSNNGTHSISMNSLNRDVSQDSSFRTSNGKLVES